ncbi:transposase [uncultured Collinsella sp.]|uniref:transposase n=1 Tax=uncultured Collinsella sp. TaxID=165190 RepID=UPI0025D89037|nr:transposase [uncultured Collinsella sp.]
MRDPKHPRQFTEELRRQIVALIDSGRPRSEVMREYDLGKSTPDRWIQRVHACGSTAAADNRTPEQNRLIEPERENARLKMEVDVLKQAAPMFARK